MSEYTLRQRISLVLESNVTAEKIVEMLDNEIDHEFLVTQRISPALLRAAKVSPLQLKRHGTDTATKLCELGFTTLHLLNESWCFDCISAYGTRQILDQFLTNANDAIILSSSAAALQLGVNLGLLVLLCGDDTLAAREVLSQYSNLKTVPPQTLIETGLVAKDLSLLGFTKKSVAADTMASVLELKSLGYS